MCEEAGGRQASDHLQGVLGPGKEAQLAPSRLPFIRTQQRDCLEKEAEARGPASGLEGWWCLGDEGGGWTGDIFMVELTELTDELGERESKELLQGLLETVLGLEQWISQSSIFQGRASQLWWCPGLCRKQHLCGTWLGSWRQGLQPPRPAPLAPQSSVSASSYPACSGQFTHQGALL